MTKQHHGTSATAFLLGLFPVFFLPVLQLMLLVMLIGLGASLRRLDWATCKLVLSLRYVAFAQFFVFFLLNAAFYSVWESPRMHYRAAALESWSISLLCLVILALWLSLQTAADIKRALIQYLPIGLTISFLVATFVYFSGVQGPRPPLFTPNPLVPPFWFLVLTMASFAWFFEMDRWNKIFRGALFFMAGVVGVYGSARLIMLAWVICGGGMALWFYLQVAQQFKLRVLIGASLSVIVGAIGVVVADSFGGGLLAIRMRVFTQIDFTYEGISAQFLRLEIWAHALSVVSQNLWFGIGQVNERLALQQAMEWERWLRAHQTYFSYLIAGGLPALASGLLMQSPALAFLTLKKRAVLIPAFLGLGVVVTMNGLTDSIFQSAVNVQAFMVATLFFLKASDAD